MMTIPRKPEVGGPVTALLLVHHLYDGHKETSVADCAAGWSVAPAPDAPPVTAVMEAALRVQCVEPMRHRTAQAVTWHHVDGNAWAAVTDLHRAGRHEDAADLARLLCWCDQQFNARSQGIWEIRTNDLSEES